MDLAHLTYQVLFVEQTASIDQWAQDLGTSKTYVRQLRDVWERFGEQHAAQETNRSFNDYLTLAGVSRERADRLVAAADSLGETVSTVHRNRKDRDDRERQREEMDAARRSILERGRLRELAQEPKVLRALEREVEAARRRRLQDAPPPADKPAAGRSPFVETVEDIDLQVALPGR